MTFVMAFVYALMAMAFLDFMTDDVTFYDGRRNLSFYDGRRNFL